MDATFWSMAALILFIILLVYLKVPGMIFAALDKRSKDIQEKLDEAQNMREEAQQLLAEYQRKRIDAQNEAKSIIQAAEREAQTMLEEAKQRQEAYIKRQTQISTDKIAQSQASAKAEIKAIAVDMAIKAVKNIIDEKTDQNIKDKMFEKNINEIKNKLN